MTSPVCQQNSSSQKVPAETAPLDIATQKQAGGAPADDILLLSSIESVLAQGITMWFAGRSATDQKAPQWVMRTAEKINGCPPPSLEDIASMQCLNKARNIIKENTYPRYKLFALPPSGSL